MTVLGLYVQNQRSRRQRDDDMSSQTSTLAIGATVPARMCMYPVEFAHVGTDSPQLRDALQRNEAPIDHLENWYKVNTFQSTALGLAPRPMTLL